MTPKKVLVFLLALSALLLQACGASEGAVATALAETQQISQLQTAAAGGGGAQEQPANTDTPSPGLAFVSVSQNTNCRSGPSTSFSILTTINVGQEVEVLKTFSSEYVLVRNPNGTGDCWLFLQFADTTDFTAFNLEVATSPPTPRVANTATKTAKPLEVSIRIHFPIGSTMVDTDNCTGLDFPVMYFLTASQPVTIEYSREQSGAPFNPAEIHGTLDHPGQDLSIPDGQENFHFPPGQFQVEIEATIDEPQHASSGTETFNIICIP